jgi:hypothetical protein
MGRLLCLKGGVFLALSALAVSVSAHHSFAMFDNKKEVTLNGTVKAFQWTNPHIWVQVMAPDSSGKLVEWSIEGGSINGLARNGWSRNSLKPGDKVVIVTHPLKDGRPGGALVSATVDGKRIGRPQT